jgi:hypothetical protein
MATLSISLPVLGPSVAGERISTCRQRGPPEREMRDPPEGGVRDTPEERGTDTVAKGARWDNRRERCATHPKVGCATPQRTRDETKLKGARWDNRREGCATHRRVGCATHLRRGKLISPRGPGDTPGGNDFVSNNRSHPLFGHHCLFFHLVVHFHHGITSFTAP